jgi:hypothetical protein
MIFPVNMSGDIDINALNDSHVTRHFAARDFAGTLYGWKRVDRMRTEMKDK